MRHTRGHTGNRRSHHALKQTNIITDKETGTLRLPHHIDEATGMYRGKQIFTPKVKKAVTGKKVKGTSTEPTPAHVHDHAHDHANAEVKPAAKGLKGVIGKLATGGKPKARSGFGGGA